VIAKVQRVRRLGAYAHLTLRAAKLARQAKPGQFVEVRITGEGAPFWRRPFSICRADRETIGLFVKAVGPGTRLLARAQAGEALDVVGPLGHGFTLAGRADRILVGGGYGGAPLLFLAERLRAAGRRVEVLLGGRCEEDLLLRRTLKLAGARTACTTEDGSFGTRGRVTDLLERRLQAASRQALRIAACGPRPMLAAVAKLAAKYGIAAEVSLEESMACGLGVCHGCVQKVGGEYRRVCKDGPVFTAQDVDWHG
jgi:dihydroorotate dehydrogenase electron transfer subunit